MAKEERRVNKYFYSFKRELSPTGTLRLGFAKNPNDWH